MRKKKILLVEDDEQFSRLLLMALRSTGYDVLTAPDAVYAVSAARSANPDLIILDLGLPAGDGFLVMERLTALPDVADIPVIVLSARDPRTNEQRSLKAGAKAFFQKPADQGELLKAVRESLGETPLSEPAPVSFK